MEKIKNDNRPLQKKYPAPYSQSWAGLGHPKRSITAETSSDKHTSGIENIAKKYSSGKPASPRNIDPQQRFTGLDPTVPHLKYGLFPKKIYISRGQSRILTVKPSVRTTLQADDTKRERPGLPRRPHCIVEPKRLKIERPAIAKASTVQKFLHNQTRAQGELSDGPVFVFRPLEHRNIRSLTLSASTHLDIKPRPLHGPILSPQLYKRYL